MGIYKEGLKYKTVWTLTKKNKQKEIIEKNTIENNVMLTEGITQLWNLITGATAGTLYNTASSYLGVGSGVTSETAADTGLSGTNTAYVGMDTGYPVVSGTSAYWKATFDTDVANFAWEEFTVANGNTNTALNLNRKTSSQGTKTSGQQWELTLQITLS